MYSVYQSLSIIMHASFIINHHVCVTYPIKHMSHNDLINNILASTSTHHQSILA